MFVILRNIVVDINTVNNNNYKINIILYIIVILVVITNVIILIKIQQLDYDKLHRITDHKQQEC